MRGKLLLFFLILSFFGTTIYAQKGVTRVYTDYNGYWTSGAGLNISPIRPDNKHNLVGFTWDNITYSTGVNDALLNSKGIPFLPGDYQAFPVANITLDGKNSNYVALGYKEDGDENLGTYPYSLPVKISYILTRGINGLDLGSAITNIPAGTDPLMFNFGAIKDPALIGDNIPDILISQVASPGSSNLDVVWFENVNHQRVGNIVTIDMSNDNVVPAVGNWTLDLYSPVNGKISSAKDARTDRQIRIWAADASFFGLNASNYTQPLYLRYKLGGASDPAFLAFNRKFIEIINANDDDEFTEINTPVNINVLDNDSPAAVISPLSLMVKQQPAHGTATVATINGQRVITYTPNNGYEGTDSFTYQVCNNAATPSCDEAQVTLTIGSADVSVTKTANTLIPFIGGNITFDILVKNEGTGTAQGVLLKDLLPDGYTLLSVSNPAFTNGNWFIDKLNNQEERRLTITARVNSTGPYSNTASIISTSIDRVEANNTSTVQPVPGFMTDLSVTKTVNVPNAIVGSNIIFTIGASNSGPSNATGVTVTDLLPDGYTFVSASMSAGTYNAASGLWTIGSMANGTTVQTLSITAIVNATGTYTNTATIQGSQNDNNTANNSASATIIPIPKSDLSITKTVSQNTPEVNSNTVFTVTVFNNGPSASTGVIVNDLLPGGYTLLSAAPGTGTYNSSSGVWTIGNLANAASTSLTITARVNPAGVYLNTATVTASTTDPVPGNNSASVNTVPVPVTDLQITKTALKDIIHNAGTVNPGDIETFTITVKNAGPSAATGVYAVDKIPTGYTYLSHNATTGTTFNTINGKWTIGDLASGASKVLTLNATIQSAGNYVNIANVLGVEKDPDQSNNQDIAPIGNTSANLIMTKSVSDDKPLYGSNIVFKLTVYNSNSSASDAPQVNVTDILPSGFTYVSSTATSGAYQNSSGTWYIGTLIKNQSAILQITARVNSTGNYLNTATVASGVPDPVESNNTASAGVTPRANADLAITKIIDNTALNTNQGNFTLEITNNGPSLATNIVVTDVLPTGYSYVSATPSTGTYNPTDGKWTFAQLPVGSSASITLNSTLNATGNYVNTATVASILPDPVSNNNTASDQPAPLAPGGASHQSFCEIDKPTIASLVTTGVAVKWYATGTGGTVLAPGTPLRQGITYYASQTIAGAESIARLGVTVSISTIAAPAAVSAIQTFCEGSGAIVNDLQVTGLQIKWYDQLTGGNRLSGSTLLVNNSVYYASQTVEGCESITRRTITVKINSVAAPGGLAQQKFCEISAPRISDLRTSATGVVNWYDNQNSTVILSSGRPLINGHTYYATQVLSGCESVSRFAVSVVITSVPAPIARNEQTFCAADQPTIKAIQISGEGIRWYENAVGGNPLSEETLLSDGATYYASQTVEGCESIIRSLVKIILSPMPAAPALNSTDPVTYCPGDQSASLTAIASAGNTLVWYLTETGGTGSLTAPVPPTATPGTTTYYVSQRNAANCEGPRTAISVLVHELTPPPVSTGDQIVCQTATAQTLTAGATTANGYSIIWYNAAGTIIQNPTLSVAGTVTYYAAAKNDITGCVSLSRISVTLTINPLPAKPLSNGDQAECPVSPLQTLTAMATAETGSSVIWYNAATGGNIVSPLLHTTGTVIYYAAAKNNTTGCESLDRTPVKLTLYPPVEGTVDIIQPVCTERTGTITVTSANGISYTLTGTDPQVQAIANSSGIFTNVTPGIYTVQITSINTCTLLLEHIQVNQPSCPSVTLTKAADNQATKAGDIIHYTIIIKNTGNVTLTDLTVEDPGADNGSINPATVTILAGQSASVKAKHTVSQAEVNQGHFNNQAGVSGRDPDNNIISDPASDDPGTPAADDPTSVRITATPSVRLVKTGALSTDYETVVYTFTIQNTGNTTLTSITLRDDKLGINKILPVSLQPGVTTADQAVYTLTTNDKNSGLTTNSAEVTAISPSGATVTDISGTQQDNDHPTVVIIPSESSISLLKTAEINGNIITYTFVITNTGKLSLSGLRFSDAKLGITNRVIEDTLLPGSSIDFTETYTLTQSDRDLGKVINTGLVSGQTQGGTIVTDKSGTTTGNDDPTEIIVPHSPVAVNDQAETKANAPVIISVLKNDDPVNSTFDKSSLIITEQPQHGTEVVNSDATVTYTPFPGYTGLDNFSYHISDIDGYQSNTAQVTVNANFFNLIIPNTITPNGDGKNDTFKIIGLNQYAENELSIINRWGAELYRKKDYQDTWSGESLAEGTYFYVLKVKRKGSQSFEVFKGWILIKRTYIN